MSKIQQLSTQDIDALKKIGQTLKTRREELSCTVQRAADITRISAGIIQDLEKANYKDYPSLVFLRGFVRSYSKFLDIDPQEFIEELNRIFDTSKPNPAEENGKPRTNVEDAGELSSPVYTPKEVKFTLSPKLVYSLAGALLALGLFYLVYSLSTSKSAAPPVSQVEEPATKAVAATPSRVEFSAKNRGWVRVQIDQAAPEDVEVEPGKNYVWEARTKLGLTLSRGDLGLVKFNSVDFQIKEEDKDKLTELVFPPN